MEIQELHLRALCLSCCSCCYAVALRAGLCPGLWRQGAQALYVHPLLPCLLRVVLQATKGRAVSACFFLGQRPPCLLPEANGRVQRGQNGLMIRDGPPGVSPNMAAFTLPSAFNSPSTAGWNIVPWIRVVGQWVRRTQHVSDSWRSGPGLCDAST